MAGQGRVQFSEQDVGQFRAPRVREEVFGHGGEPDVGVLGDLPQDREPVVGADPAQDGPSLHGELCEAVGPEPGAARAQRLSAVRGQRDRRLRELVLTAYEYRCAFCGYDGRIGAVPVGLEAAHVRWWAFGGPDDVDNGLCLCSLHHKLFDKGVLGVGDDLRILVSQRFVGHSLPESAAPPSGAGRVVRARRAGDSGRAGQRGRRARHAVGEGASMSRDSGLRRARHTVDRRRGAAA